jgi:hypothetical protein
VPFSALARAGVRLIESILRAYYHVFEFTADPRAIVRLARSVSPRAVSLSDGARIPKGAALLVLHFRNEHLSLLLGGDASLETGLVFVRGARHTLRLLAEFLRAHREFDDVQALYGEFGFVQEARVEQVARMSARLGLDCVPCEKPGWDPRRFTFWENVYSWWMMWTYNPASLAGKSFGAMRRCEIWMSRARLTDRYGAALTAAR